MSKPIEATEESLANILLSNSGYSIPWYQRPYAWEEEHVTDLFDDLYRSYKSGTTEGYFLGSIVLTDEQSNKEKGIIDGQQRLTTLTILFACLAYHVKENGGDDKYKESLKKYIINPGDETQGVAEKPRLSIRKRDREFFEEYIHELKFDEWLVADSEQPKKPKRKSKKIKLDPKILIRNNSVIFLKRIKKYFDNDIPALKQFVKFLTSECSFVVISTPNKETASRVFYVMNSRGLDLQPTDIIKANVMESATHDESLNNVWEEMEDALGREDFNHLFYYVRMIRAKKKLEESILKEFSKHFFDDMNKPSDLIKKTLKLYSDALLTVRNSSYESTSEEKSEPINNYLDWLTKINNSDWIPPAIQFLAKHKNNPDYLLYFFERLERLSAYLYICSKSVNKRIERYAEVIREVEGKHDLQNPPQSLELTDAEKKEMLDTLSSDIYNMTAQKRNYILLRLDSFMVDGNATYNPRTLTIEHVLPQNPSENSEWLQKWNKEQREEWLHKLANLLPLNKRRNSAAQNYDFERKKNAYFKGTSNMNSYALTSQIILVEEWTPEVVERRQATLLEKLTEKWGLA